MNGKVFLMNRKTLAGIALVSLFAVSLVYANVNGQLSSSVSLDRDYITVAKWGKQGDTNGRFDLPRSLTVDNKGYVYVVDVGNARVQKFADRGRYIS